MANEEHLKILKRGVEAWNKWRAKNPIIKVDLSGADLLREALYGANFGGANLSGISLGEGVLLRANLSKANLSKAELAGVNLTWANLSKADLTGADLAGVNLTGAVLGGAILNKAELYETVFANVDLSKTKGLDECRHGGPSIIDHRTLENPGTCQWNSSVAADFPTPS